VKAGKIKFLEEIYLYSLPVKEAEVIDYFLKDALKDEVLKVMPVQKQTSAGQRTRFKYVQIVYFYFLESIFFFLDDACDDDKVIFIS
jgi:small subunit ribosomal protein S2e